MQNLRLPSKPTEPDSVIQQDPYVISMQVRIWKTLL